MVPPSRLRHNNANGFTQVNGAQSNDSFMTMYGKWAVHNAVMYKKPSFSTHIWDFAIKMTNGHAIHPFSKW